MHFEALARTGLVLTIAVACGCSRRSWVGDSPREQLRQGHRKANNVVVEWKNSEGVEHTLSTNPDDGLVVHRLELQPSMEYHAILRVSPDGHCFRNSRTYRRRWERDVGSDEATLHKGYVSSEQEVSCDVLAGTPASTYVESYLSKQAAGSSSPRHE